MAVTVDELRAVMRMEMKPFMRDLQQVNGVNAKTARQVEQTWRAANRQLDGIGKNMARSLVAPMTGIATVLGARELAALTDTWTDLTSRVNLAAGSLDKGEEVMDRLSDTARRTYSALELTAESYLANATALRELGYSTDQQLDYTESLNNALVISAARGQRAEAVQNALAKAMAAGRLQGDNLNTVIEQGGRVAEALAAGLGVGVNQLRALGTAGKITGRDVFRALTSQMQTLRQEAEQMPATISDGIQLLRNALLEYVGKGDQAVGVSVKISEALVIMADNFDTTADVALQLAAVIAGALIGRSLLRMITTLGLAGTALTNFTRALAAARTMTGLSMAFSGLGAAAGPVGLLIGGAVVSSLIAFSNVSAQASDAADTYAKALERVREAATEAADAVSEASEGVSAEAANKLIGALGLAEAEIQRYRRDAIAAIDSIYDRFDRNIITDAQLAQFDGMRKRLAENADAADEVKQELFALANANPDFSRVASGLAPILNALYEAVEASRILKAELGASDSPATFNRGGRVRARRALLERREEGRAYEQDALRRAQLGKAQLDLENEIARVRKQAEQDSVKLTEDQIKRIAEANIAGNAARSAEGKKPTKERADEYQRLTERIREQTVALVAENAALAGVNPLVDDYGRAQTEAAMAQDILTAAKKAGVAGASEFHDVQQMLYGDLTEMSPAALELAEAIRKLISGYVDADVAGRKLARTQDEIRRKAEEMQDFQKDLTRGIVDGFLEGKKAADIFSDALTKVGNKLLDMAFDSLFDMPSRGGGGFNFLGFLGSLIPGRASGGPVRAGQPYIVGERRPELFVPSQNGTIVPRVPKMPKVGGGSAAGSSSFTYAPVIDARGASVEAVARLEQVLAQDRADFEARVVKTVRGAKKQRVL
ncbi:tape measure protein [Aquamicrobium sp. LC103]|uniref:tape measure protein n=1 Tax=Aquamicrobium sp. LC103 TaxID=1120658 RepID=UPI00063ECA8B|nr:tape measure protein [Aquamicrobium sp. LC103]TKT78426.1 phage tail tape measure protein [Aquamicrobium sp. LC103]